MTAIILFADPGQTLEKVNPDSENNKSASAGSRVTSKRKGRVLL